MRYKKLNHTRFHPIGSVSLFFIIFFTWLTPSVFAAQGTTANDTTNQAKIIQNRVPNAPITFGQTITDTISLPGEQDSYTFTGSSGDTVRIRMLDLDGGAAFGPRIWLYRLDGVLLCTSASADLLADVTCSLNASGV
ncbi:MAG: hypothetical protein IAE79_28140, partial [Anaerolinea sp.]|nr:hypothetical protein [Anaerolinea sp.]